MCSPFSSAFWQNSWNSYQSVGITEQNATTYDEDEEDTLFDRDSESFRLFASPREILSRSWREHLTEITPFWEKRRSLAQDLACPRSLYCCKLNAGLMLTATSGVLFAIASLFVKLSANTTIPAFEIVFIRLVTQTLLVLPASIWARANLLGDKEHRPFLLCFGIVNFASISCIYGAFTKLPLGDATVCISTTPIFTAFLAYVFLKESCRAFDIVATFTCLGGVVLITKPTFLFGNAGHVTMMSHLTGYAVALSGALVQSLTFIMVRKTGASVSFYTNVFYFGWCSAVLSGVAMFVFQKPVIPDCGATRWFLLGVALCGVFGSFCLNRGLQMENAAPAALMRNVDIFLAFIFDYIIFNQTPNALTVLGGVIVVMSTGGVALAKWWRSRDSI